MLPDIMKLVFAVTAAIFALRPVDARPNVTLMPFRWRRLKVTDLSLTQNSLIGVSRPSFDQTRLIDYAEELFDKDQANNSSVFSVLRGRVGLIYRDFIATGGKSRSPNNMNATVALIRNRMYRDMCLLWGLLAEKCHAFTPQHDLYDCLRRWQLRIAAEAALCVVGVTHLKRQMRERGAVKELGGS